MRKNEKGITMVALVIVIVVMLIISGIVLYYGTSQIKSARTQSISTNMLLIQAKARTISDKASFEGEQTLGKKMEDEEKIKEISGTEDVSNLEIYELSQEDLYEMGIDVSGDSLYAVDYKNDEVYYLKGVKAKGGDRYYKLSDISNLDVEISDEEESEE